MKKFFALALAMLLMLTMFVACGNESNDNKADANNATSEPEVAAEAKTYQFYGSFKEEGEYSSFLNAAFLLELNEDGTAVCDKYAFGSYDDSDAATNSSYQTSYLSGTWKEVEKDGVPCLQIKLAYVDDNGTESNNQTCYAYDVAGVYSFEMVFPVVPGQSYTRTVMMEGVEGKTYADDNAFIAAYKATFEAPAYVGLFEDAEKGATAYLQEDGTMLMYAGYDKVADGKWSMGETGLALTIGGEAVELTVDGTAASFVYVRDLAGYTMEYALTCADTSVLGAPVVDEAAPYTTAIDMAGNATTAELVLNEDGTASLKVFTDFACTYTQIGSAVILEVSGELEGYAAQIWPYISHVYLLNEDKSMQAVVAAYSTDSLALIALDESNMLVQFPAYGMERDGFTYVLSEDGTQLTITAPSEDVLGAFAQIWAGVGGENWVIDGTTANKAE